jgi:uncharacterized protein YjiK
MAGCDEQENVKAVSSSSGSAFRYDLNKPETFNLPPGINEISGISYNPADNTVFAIDDESGYLFKISLDQQPVVENWEFDKKRDFEEIVVVNNTAYALVSSGKVVYFPVSFPVKNTATASLDIEGKNEFESLYRDPAANRLLMMCKDCKGDGKDGVSIYAFDLSTNTFNRRAIGVLNTSNINKKSGKKTDRFKPSAARIHPQTGELYIISSVNKMLVVADKNFAIQEVRRLDPSIFKQPEGLDFTPSGDMLISNEAGGSGNANILLFRQK